MSTAIETMVRGASFSPDRTYRYALWRVWDGAGGYTNKVAFIGLNPSKADETTDDATIRKCIGFAKRWGFGGIYMLNLFSIVSTDPKGMIFHDKPVGLGNHDALRYYRKNVAAVIACWGSMEMRYRPRLGWQSQIQETLNAINSPVYCLGKTKDGSPKHPSRIAYSTERELFWSPGMFTTNR